MQWLEEYRKEIDKLDKELIEVLFKRFELVKKVWEYKKEHDIKPLQKWRWQEVLDRAKKSWEEKWLDSDFIETLWNNMHSYALKLEK